MDFFFVILHLVFFSPRVGEWLKKENAIKAVIILQEDSVSLI